MRIPTLKGTIKRRILVNFRANPETVQRLLPEGFRPKLHRGKVEFTGTFTDKLPNDSIFEALEDSSESFRGGALGYSVTRDATHLDGITLETKEWKVRPLAAEEVGSSFYDDKSLFPDGTIEFDHALIMQNVEHEWYAAPDFELFKDREVNSV